MNEKKIPEESLPLSRKEVDKRLSEMAPILKQLFSQYIIVGLRRLPAEEAVARGYEEVPMYRLFGDLPVVGGMAMDAARGLAADLLRRKAKQQEDKYEVVPGGGSTSGSPDMEEQAGTGR